MGEDDEQTEIGVVLSKRVQRVAGRGDGIDCSDVRVLPVLGCRRAARVQSAEERAAMLGQRGCGGLATDAAAAVSAGPGAGAAALVDMAELDVKEAVTNPQ